MATGGFGTSGSIPGASSFTVEEMQAAVVEAAKRGIKVAAHAHGAEGIKNALNAGVQSIEHGSFLDQEVIDLLKEKEAFLVMDLLAAYFDYVVADKDFSDKALGGTNLEEYQKLEKNLENAFRQGVKMAFGTDAGIYEHGQNARQFHLMQKAGMPAIDCIRSATTVSAELLGLWGKAGTIAPGKWADLIAVEGNPLEDIRVLEKVVFVMKEGKTVKR